MVVKLSSAFATRFEDFQNRKADFLHFCSSIKYFRLLSIRNNNIVRKCKIS